MLPTKVIDKLFFRLSNVYGSQWSALWKDNDIAEVKQLWADQLSFYGQHLEAFAWALDHLPERVPNLVQFKKLLSDAPLANRIAAIEYNPAAPIPQAIADEIKTIVASRKYDHKAWAKRILKDVEDGVPRSLVAVSFAKEAMS